jgi:hypothetical protein
MTMEMTKANFGRVMKNLDRGIGRLSGRGGASWLVPVTAG